MDQAAGLRGWFACPVRAESWTGEPARRLRSRIADPTSSLALTYGAALVA